MMPPTAKPKVEKKTIAITRETGNKFDAWLMRVNADRIDQSQRPLSACEVVDELVLDMINDRISRSAETACISADV